MLVSQLTDTSHRVAATRSRTAKVALLAEALRSALPGEAGIAASWLSGQLRQRRTGLGWRSLASLPAPAAEATLSVTEADATLDALSRLSGAGSQAARASALEGLMSRATASEQAYLRDLITGNVRQGALAGLVVDAVAAASGAPLAAVRRAAMFAGGAPAIAEAAMRDGETGLRAFGLRLMTPVLPMLASPGGTLEDAWDAFSGRPVAVEAKLDGIRIQAHKDGEDVRLFTRSLDDVTARMPEVVEVVRSVDAMSAILDGEVLSLDEEGHPRPFQETASRTASVAGVALTPFFFDLLLVEGESWVDAPLSARSERLAAIIPARHTVQRTITADRSVAEAFTRHVLDQGHEGVVVKALEAPYDAGRRGAAWLKVKPVHTFDLVVLAVEWGSGRRQGTLSNIHLGARDGDGFVMLGKTFKGMTDEMLAWQTQRFLALETHREGHVVHVRPEQVVEIAIDGIQRSPRYPGGVALRFARVIRYRDDKTAEQADTLKTVRALFS